MVYLLWRKPNSSSHCHSHILHRKIPSFGLILPTVYTSKSGYRFLKQEANIDHLDTHHEAEQTLWRSIWSLQVPNKVKNLLWRATRESLPTKQNLQRRTITDCSLCDRCKLEPETTLHATWSCRQLEVVWEDASVWRFRRSRSFLSFKELLSWLLMNTQEVELFAVTAWSIWNQRNRVRMHQPSCSAHLLAATAKESLAEFLSVQPAAPLPNPKPRVEWQPPPQGLVKISGGSKIFF